jgi:hypothetical protein
LITKANGRTSSGRLHPTDFLSDRAKVTEMDGSERLFVAFFEAVRAALRDKRTESRSSVMI